MTSCVEHRTQSARLANLLRFGGSGDVADLGARVRRIKAGIDTVTGVNLVVGFGPRACAGLASADQPADFTAFEEVIGADGFTMPATQHDLWLWAHGNGADNVLDVVLASRRPEETSCWSNGGCTTSTASVG